MVFAKTVVAAVLLVASFGAAQAGPLDVLNTMGNIAGAVSDTHQSLSEGRLPDIPNVGGKGGHGSGHGGGKHAGGGGGGHKHK